MLELSALPTLNAGLNALAALLLVTGYRFIRAGRVPAHRACMAAAFGTSVAFLVSYTIYHFHQPATPFPGTSPVRTFYYGMLFTHVVLASAVPPLAILTLWRALRGEFDRHRRLARWTLPIWLYVSVTGVLVYLMLYHLYPAGA